MRKKTKDAVLEINSNDFETGGVNRDDHFIDLSFAPEIARKLLNEKGFDKHDSLEADAIEFGKSITPKVAIVNLTPMASNHTIDVIWNKGNGPDVAMKLKHGQHFIADPRHVKDIAYTESDDKLALPLSLNGEEATLAMKVFYSQKQPHAIEKETVKPDIVPHVSLFTIASNNLPMNRRRFSLDGMELTEDNLKLTDSTYIVPNGAHGFALEINDCRYVFIRSGLRKWAPESVVYDKLNVTEHWCSGLDGMHGGRKIMKVNKPVNKWMLKATPYADGFNEFHYDMRTDTEKVELYSEDYGINMEVAVNCD